MSKFHFDENAMDSAATQIGNIGDNIGGKIESMKTILSDLYFEDGFDIIYAINGMSEEISNFNKCVQNIKLTESSLRSVSQIVKRYSTFAKVQNIISDKFDDMVSIVQSAANEKENNDSNSTDTFDTVLSYTNKAVSKAGVLGSLLSVGKPAVEWLFYGTNGSLNWSDYTDPKYTLEVIKSGVSAEKALAGLVGKENDVKAWLGFTKAEVKPIWSDYIIKKGATTAEKVKTGLSYANLFVSGAINAYSNFHEENTTERRIAETIMETAVDVGKGWLVTTGLALVGAPAILGGAVYVGIELGSQLLFQESSTEVISDGLLDLGGIVLNGAKKVGDNIVSGAKSVISSISDGINVLGRGFNSLFA